MPYDADSVTKCDKNLMQVAQKQQYQADEQIQQRLAQMRDHKEPTIEDKLISKIAQRESGPLKTNNDPTDVVWPAGPSY